MKLLFKQRLFSWFDSYDVYDEAGNTIFSVKGELALGHLLRIYDANGNDVGRVKEKLIRLLPKFEMYIGENYAGCISKEFTIFRPKFNVEYNGWHVEGDWFEWDYTIIDSAGQRIASVTKELWNWTDTYVIDVCNPQDALCALMLVLAIDAEKCSRGKNDYEFQFDRKNLNLAYGDDEDKFSEIFGEVESKYRDGLQVQEGRCVYITHDETEKKCQKNQI